ncbi:MAG TPA: hypothetical protein DDW49_04550 [Deltaproteobacteria bacterium]|nr:MAG: hypothetical protein A2048_04050 [Deltaproteobacteria bacterium GWA2_45_12]HBF12650.1 hypothetical protein [Deltaproteobacteria bacterium]
MCQGGFIPRGYNGFKDAPKQQVRVKDVFLASHPTTVADYARSLGDQPLLGRLATDTRTGQAHIYEIGTNADDLETVPLSIEFSDLMLSHEVVELAPVARIGSKLCAIKERNLP